MRIVLVAATLAALAPSLAAAQAPQAVLTLAPWASYDGVDRPYRYIVELRSTSAPVEVVADRRLLSFAVHEGRRTLRCRHPAAPSRVQDARVRTLRPGDEASATWREWIDLRMYCTGRALRALERGAEVDVRYGWPRATRQRWVVRSSADAPTREWVASLEAPPIAFPAQPSGQTRRVDVVGGAPSPIDVELAPASARTASALVLRTAIRARDGSERIYERSDAWRFRVRGPLGDVTCATEMGGGTPPPELFRRITRRAAVREALDADFFCPRGTFQVAGVYEVTPEVRLAQSGEEWGFSAITGRFEGPTAPVRITAGDRAAYVEQEPERAESPHD